VSARRAERAYALLLRVYPAEFRDAYARDMMVVFRDLVRQAGAPSMGFWMTIVADVARSAPPLRAEALRARWNAGSRMEGRMKPMGILAMLIGLMQSVNAIVELRAGSHTGAQTAAVLVAVVVGLLLVAAGVAMLRRTRQAATLAQVAAIAWLVLVVLARVTYPWMSMVSMLLAVVFPVALLVYVWRSRGGGAVSA
jgi:hypothetical protein